MVRLTKFFVLKMRFLGFLAISSDNVWIMLICFFVLPMMSELKESQLFLIRPRLNFMPQVRIALQSKTAYNIRVSQSFQTTTRLRSNSRKQNWILGH